jgi:hypothetical protein
LPPVAAFTSKSFGSYENKAIEKKIEAEKEAEEETGNKKWDMRSVKQSVGR